MKIELIVIRSESKFVDILYSIDIYRKIEYISFYIFDIYTFLSNIIDFYIFICYNYFVLFVKVMKHPQYQRHHKYGVEWLQAMVTLMVLSGIYMST